MSKDQAPQQPQPAPDLDLELADEQQILDELSGVHFERDKFVYAVRDGFQLTYRGVKFACRKLEEKGEVIEVIDKADVHYDPKDPEYLCVQVLARRVKIDPKTGTRIVLGSEIGSKRKWVKEKLKSGEVRPDQSFFEKAVSLAQRNAKLALLPQDFVLDLIKLIRKNEGAVPQGAAKTAPSKPKKEAAPPAPAAAQAPTTPPAGKEASATQASAPAADVDSQKKRQLTMQQQFWAVFKTAVPQAKTEAQQRGVLVRLTGKDRVRDLTEDLIRSLGPELRRVGQGESVLKDVEQDGAKTLTIINTPTGEIRWPVGFKIKTASPPPAAQEESAPPDGAPSASEEAMF